MVIHKRKRWGGKIALAVVVVAAAVLLFPVEQTVAPRWFITVVDEKGARLSGLEVRETWRQRSIEPKAHEEIRKTDATGVVTFPRRSTQVSYASRMMGCWAQRRKSPSPGACGPHAEIWAFGSGLGPMDPDDIREIHAQYIRRELKPDLIVEQQTSMILLHHCPPGHYGTGCSLSEYVPSR